MSRLAAAEAVDNFSKKLPLRFASCLVKGDVGNAEGQRQRRTQGGLQSWSAHQLRALSTGYERTEKVQREAHVQTTWIGEKFEELSRNQAQRSHFASSAWSSTYGQCGEVFSSLFTYGVCFWITHYQCT